MHTLKVAISNSHVNNEMEIKTDQIINLLQDVEGLHINNLKTFTNYLNENNLGVFLVYRQVEIIERAKFGEEVYLSTYPFKTTPFGGYRHMYIKNAQGKTIVKATSFGAFVNLKTYSVTRLPREVNEWVKDGIQDPTIKLLNRKIDYDENSLILKTKIKVEKSFIDRYNHLNNAYYISFALNNMESDNYFNIRVEYKKSFIENDIIYLYEDTSSNDKKFVFKNEQQEVYTIIEFSK